MLKQSLFFYSCSDLAVFEASNMLHHVFPNLPEGQDVYFKIPPVPHGPAAGLGRLENTTPLWAIWLLPDAGEVSLHVPLSGMTAVACLLRVCDVFVACLWRVCGVLVAAPPPGCGGVAQFDFWRGHPRRRGRPRQLLNLV